MFPLPWFFSMSNTNAMWQDVSEEEFVTAIDDEQIVHWRSNLFKLPSGACGKCFITELTRLFAAFATESTLEDFAIKVAMTMPALLLQNPHVKSKSQAHVSCLNCRLSLWKSGDIENLLKEGKLIQRHLPKLPSSSLSSNKDNPKLAHKFSKLMMEVRASLKLLSPKLIQAFSV